MSYERCQKEFLRNIEIDFDKINSLVKMAKTDLEIISEISLNSKTASKLSKDYYEIIKDLLIALLLCQGIKSSNHECLISYFKREYDQYEYESKIIHELKDIRNRISYDGYFVDLNYVNKNVVEFKHIIELLEKLIKDKIPKMGQVD